MHHTLSKVIKNKRTLLTSQIIIVFVSSILVLLSIFIRFYNLQLSPYSLNWDEGAYAYNALSIMKTGKDEWGQKFPLFLKSYGDNKPALLSYIQIPFIYTMGSTDLAVRLPTALMGLISLLFIYQYVKNLQNKVSDSNSKLVPLLTALVVAISPWHIHYSKVAMDPIVSFFFLMAGLAFFTNKRVWIQWIGVIALMAAVYTYNSARLFLLLLLPVQFVVFEFKNTFKRNNKFLKVLQYACILIFTLSFVLITAFTSVGSRAQAVFILNSPEILNETNEMLFAANELSMPFKRLYSNKVINFSTLFAENYFSHFDLSFLFFDNNLSSRHAFLRYGNLLLSTLPLLVIGIITTNFKKRLNTFFLLWVIFAPIASALTDDVPHSGRTLILLPALAFFIAKGFIWSYEKIRSAMGIVAAQAASILALLILFSNFGLYVIDLYRFYPEDAFFDFQGKTKVVAQALSKVDISSYETIFISKELIDSPILFAWYYAIHPEVFQTLELDIIEEKNLYQNFSIISTDKCVLKQENVLFISNENLFPNNHGESNILYTYTRTRTKQPIAYVYESNALNFIISTILNEQCGSK